MVFTLVMEGRVCKGRGGREEKKLKAICCQQWSYSPVFPSESHNAERIESRGCVYLLNPCDMTTALKAHGKLLFLQGVDVFEPTV